MVEVKLTKNGLRSQQQQLVQLERYLPTLQVKKAMLQAEILEAKQEIYQLESKYHQRRLLVSEQAPLLSEQIGIDLTLATKIEKIHRRMESIAGVDLPFFEGVDFAPFEYPLFTTPAWVDPLIVLLRNMTKAKAELLVAEEKKIALEKELRDVSIRVNLFEKKLIPEALQNIRKIKIFLEDQLLGAVAQAKVAKGKIQKKKKKKNEI